MPEDATTTIPEGELRALHRRAQVGELAAGLAHEARNLMTAILGFAQIGREQGADRDELLGKLATIERESRRVLELLERHLDASRAMEHGRESIDVCASVREVSLLMAPRMRTVRATTVLALPDTALGIQARRGELEQVLINLIGNAIDAMPEGGRVEVSTGRRGSEVEIVVIDDGPGIAPDALPRIFEPFFSTKGRGGLGLGLPMCRQIVEDLGGVIEVVNEDGRGARVTIRLPAEVRP